MAKSITIETRDIVFEIGKYAQSWLTDEAQLGAFSVGSLEYNEQYRIEYLGKLKTMTISILERKLIEDEYPVTFNYKTPKSWWQMLKEEHAPAWFVRCYPVQHKQEAVKRTVRITRKATYPLADIAVPTGMGRAVIKDLVSPLTFYKEES